MHFFLESLVLVLVLLFAPGARASAYNVTCDDVTNPATCYGVCELKRDECHCVRENRNKKCPKKPKIGYEQDIIDALKSQQARNPFTLLNGCNPFFDPTCQTVPPLADVSPKESTEGKKQDVPVCGIKYDESDDPLGRNLRAKSASLLAKSAQKIDGDCPAFYTLQTYENLVEASRDGAFVTHLGGEFLLCASLMLLTSPASPTFSFRLFLTYIPACGLCSTTNDLAVYMETPNYESALVACFLSNYDLNSGVFPTPAQIGASILCMVQNVGFTIVSLPSELQLVYGCKVLCTDIFSAF